MGVQELGPDGCLMRVALKTAPLEQWGVARALRERIKARFDYEGITIPFPQRVVWHHGATSGSDDGHAAPQRLDATEAPEPSGASER